MEHKVRSNVLSIEEERIIVERLKFATSRGFAIDLEGLKSIMARVAADVCPGWKHGVSSDDAVRSFRTAPRYHLQKIGKQEIC